jgi:hypothetical protein
LRLSKLKPRQVEQTRGKSQQAMSKKETLIKSLKQTLTEKSTRQQILQKRLQTRSLSKAKQVQRPKTQTVKKRQLKALSKDDEKLIE